jgi:signal transduction histidine kinase
MFTETHLATGGTKETTVKVENLQRLLPVHLLCGMVLLVACGAIIGWVWHIPILTSVFPHYSTMKPNTALGIGSVAVSCWLRRRRDGPASRLQAGFAIAAASFALVLSAGTLLEYVTRRDFGLDGFFLQVPLDRFGDPAGRMAPGTATCIFLSALALLVMEALPRLSVWCLITVCAITSSALIGFVFNAGPLMGVAWLRSVAIHTALGLLLVAVTALYIRPEREPVYSLTQQSYRDGRSYWLLVAVTLLPTMVALAPVVAMRAGAIDPGFAVAAVVVVLTAVQTWILWRDSVALGRAEHLRQQTEYALMQSEKLAIVGRLSASISHEIKNPLESVNTLMYLVRDAESLEEAQSFALTAEGELARINQIASETLTFYRETRGNQHCDPSEIVESSLNLLATRITASSVTVIKDFREPLGKVNCGSGELRQIFINLISNAVEATPRNGRLTIRIRRARTQPTHPWGASTQGIRITFADTGSGIDAEIRKNIFQPFFTTKTDTGNGLGLWVAQDLVNKLGGSIRVWSSTQPGATGTVFSIFLPLTSE